MHTKKTEIRDGTALSVQITQHRKNGQCCVFFVRTTRLVLIHIVLRNIPGSYHRAEQTNKATTCRRSHRNNGSAIDKYRYWYVQLFGSIL